MSSNSVDFPLANRLGVVTGANRGIGLAIVKKMASEGCSLLALARTIDEKFIEETKRLSREFDVSIEVHNLDLTKIETINSFIGFLVASKLKIDFLVNNAGVPSGSLIHMTGSSNLREVFETNFFGPFFLTQSVSKLMAKSGGGSIINISSVSASKAQKGMAAYGSSKSAFSFVCEVLALELAEKNIRVNTIAPGLIETDMYKAMEIKAKDRMLAGVAMGRPGNANEVANLVSFLAGKESSYISGTIINIDGSLR